MRKDTLRQAWIMQQGGGVNSQHTNRAICSYLLTANTLLVSLNELTPGRRAESGTKQRLKTMSAFCRRPMPRSKSQLVQDSTILQAEVVNVKLCSTKQGRTLTTRRLVGLRCLLTSSATGRALLQTLQHLAQPTCTHRRAILPSILVAVNPGVPLRTMNAFTCSHQHRRDE